MSLVLAGCSKSGKPESTASGKESDKQIYERYLALEEKERQAQEKYWSREILAQRCSSRIDELWEALNQSPNKLQRLIRFSFGSVRFPEWTPGTQVGEGIRRHGLSGGAASMTDEQWDQWLRARIEEGWRLTQVEFRHIAFDVKAGGAPDKSRYFFFAGLDNTNRTFSIEGEIVVHWGVMPEDGGTPAVQRVEPGELTVLTREGAAPFEMIFDHAIPPRERTPFIDPLILRDLDGDGRSEVILAAKNLVFRMRDRRIEEAGPLCGVDPGIILSAVMGDFDGDRQTDYLCAKREGLQLFRGADGRFDTAPELAWDAPVPLEYVMAITSGDVDGDGDLDLWLSQYKLPYLKGQMPTPYFDANDGYPSYLLLNDGTGKFSEGTAAAGLEKKRFRRTYSASLVDLDGDVDLDLAVVSDFYGIDLYRNNGRGQFEDVTAEWVDVPYAAGMAHSLADFNLDGRLDLLMMGMHSPTVDRLEHLGLVREHRNVDHSKRAELMHGNRLLLGKAGGGFKQTELSESIARSGWSWGVGAFDFNNDRFPDPYIANGHETKWQVKDYESTYWLHDLYVGNSQEDPAKLVFFSAEGQRTRGAGYSYGGWDRNRLYLNDGGEEFVDVGHHFGVSLQRDCRNVAVDDLDSDGRVDLIVTTFEAWPEPKQTLKVFRNVVKERGNWIGVRVRGQAAGASVVLDSGSHGAVRPIVTGDSFRTQHAGQVHFGLGDGSTVESIQVRVPGGEPIELRSPAINRYHEVDLKN